MTLLRDHSALLVVDMQHDFVHGAMAVPGGVALATRLAPLVEAVRAAGIPIVFVTQALRPGGDDRGRLERFEAVRSGAALREGSKGVQVVPELRPLPSDLYVVKRRYSAFLGTDLDLLLRSRNVEQVLVCGLSAHVCCDSTVRDAFQLGYETLLLVDGVAMGDLADAGWGAIPAEDAQRVVATILAERFATVCTIADLRAELAA